MKLYTFLNVNGSISKIESLVLPKTPPGKGWSLQSEVDITQEFNDRAAVGLIEKEDLALEAQAEKNIRDSEEETLKGKITAEKARLKAERGN